VDLGGTVKPAEGAFCWRILCRLNQELWQGWNARLATNRQDFCQESGTCVQRNQKLVVQPKLFPDLNPLLFASRVDAGTLPS